MCSFGFDAVGVRNGDSELLESMRDRNVRHAAGEIDVGKSSVGNDELDSDKQSFWVQNGIGRRFLSPDVFSDGLYTGGESFWSRLSGSSAEWLRKLGFYKK